MRWFVPIILIVALVAGGLYFAYVRAHSEPGMQGPVLTVRFLDESFGCAIVLKSPEGKVVVIDPASRRETDALVDMLNRERVCEVAVVISDPSREHAIGLVSLAKAVNITKLIRPELGPSTEEWNKLLARAKCEPILETVIARGDTVMLSKKIRLKALNPIREQAHGGDDSSLVFRVCLGDKSILFPTNIRIAGEAELIQSGQNLTSDVLVVGRHGRYGSTSLELLSMVRPQICVVAAGHGSNSGSTSVLNRLSARNTGAALYQTDKDGIIDIVTDGHTIQVGTGGVRP